MGASESLFIAQIIVLLLVGRLLGEAMQRIGQSAVMGLASRRPAGTIDIRSHLARGATGALSRGT